MKGTAARSVEVTAGSALADSGDSGGPLLCGGVLVGVVSCHVRQVAAGGDRVRGREGARARTIFSSMRLPEHACPRCHRQVTLSPTGDGEGRNTCTVCGASILLLEDRTLAVPLPRNVRVVHAVDALDVRLENRFATFGIVDRALVLRVELDAVAWSRAPLLEPLRFSEAWGRIARASLRRFDWRPFESGTRGQRGHLVWSDLVFVAHDGAEERSGHRFPETFDATAITTVLQWAHDSGVPRSPSNDNAYRSMSAESSLTLVAANGAVQRLRGT